MERLIPVFCIVSMLFILGCLGLINKLQFGVKLSQALKKGFIFICLLLFLILVLFFGVYSRGYWTTKIVIWSFLLVAALLFAFEIRQILFRSWRVLAGILFYFPIVSVALIFIPSFLGTLLSLNLWLHIIGDEKAIYYNNNEIRIQKLRADCDAGFKGYPRYLRKKGIFEFDKGLLDNGNNCFDDRIRVEKAKSTILVYLYYTNADPVPFTFER